MQLITTDEVLTIDQLTFMPSYMLCGITVIMDNMTVHKDGSIVMDNPRLKIDSRFTWIQAQRK